MLHNPPQTGPSEEIFQVRNQWTLGLCGLAASIACSVTVWGQEDIQQQVANREQAIAQFRAQYPGVDFYESANRITKVYGMPFGGGPSPHDVGEQFRFAHSAMLGVPPQDLVAQAGFEGGTHLQPLMYQNGQPKFTGVNYTQVRDGVPVYRSRLILLTRNEPNYPLVLATSDLRDLGAFTVNPQVLQNVDARAGIAQARKSMPADTVFTPATPVIFAGVDDDAHVPVLALNFSGEGGNMADGSYSSREFVTDAATGAILYTENLVYDIDINGTVRANVTDGYVADPCANENPQPLPYLRVSLGATNVFADANGNFTMPNAGTAQVTLTAPLIGQYFVVNNQQSATSSASLNVTPPGPADILHNPANATEGTRAEVNAYRHANIARNLVVAANPAYPTVSTQSNFPINVNIASTCNAFYSSSTINFYLSGGGCNNTGFGTVVHHEYGHNVVAKGGSGQGAYGEGMGDVLGLLVTDSPVTGVGFQNCANGIRTAANSCQYQLSNCSSCGSEVHACGNLISGCVWSLRNNLAGTNPATYRDILADLAVNSILVHTGALITPQISIDYMTLDDNDADLSNGTPHRTEIHNAFAAHNMAIAMQFTYPLGRPTLVSPAGTTPLRVAISAGTQSPTGATLNVDSGAGFVGVPMPSVGPGTFEANFPASTCGTTVRYYVTGQGTGPSTAVSPTGAPGSYFSAFSALSFGTTVFSDNFQTNLGWAIANDAGLTAGGWQRATPVTNCNRGNPLTDGDGSGQCYLTQNSGGPAGDACNTDVDGGATTLTSPIMDASNLSLLSYWRWYSNNFGSAPNADTMLVQISSNGGTTWQALETVGPVNEAGGGWVLKQWNLGSIPGFALTNQFRIRFVAQDTGTASVVEAAVDGVKLQRFNCPSLAGDINGDGVVDVNDLLAVISAWGPCPTPPIACPADIAPAGGNGVIDVNDLLVVISNWT